MTRNNKKSSVRPFCYAIVHQHRVRGLSDCKKSSFETTNIVQRNTEIRSGSIAGLRIDCILPVVAGSRLGKYSSLIRFIDGFRPSR